jgi:hypothetical protein
MNQAIFKVVAIAAFEGKFVVVDDGAAHGASEMLKIAFFSPAQPRRAKTRLSSGLVPGLPESSTYP